MTTPVASSGRSCTRAEAVGATLVAMLVSISSLFFMGYLASSFVKPSLVDARGVGSDPPHGRRITCTTDHYKNRPGTACPGSVGQAVPGGSS